MQAHQAARAVIRETAPHVKVGLTLSLHDIQAVPGGEENAAKEWAEEFTHYLSAIESDDFLGVQNYTRSRIGADGQLPTPDGAELTQMDYEFYPEALEHVIRAVHKDFKGDLIVTENGIATADDSRRIEFIRRALAGIRNCIADGIPVKGYCYWSLLDNFEWQKGYDVEQYPYLIGDFVWTSMDYMGEAGIGKTMYVEPGQASTAARMMHSAPYPWRSAGCGDFDLCGFERPQLAYRRILWGSKETKIYCHDPRNYGKVELLGRYGWPDCANSWTWPVAQGSPVKIEVYSPAAEVELLLNGESQGRKVTEHNKALFQIPYTHGQITAISYNGDAEISRDTLRSAGAEAGLKITADKTILDANGQALCFAMVELVDKDGEPVPYAEARVTASVEGDAFLQAFGSARPMTEENYTSGLATAYHGRLLAVVRAGENSGHAVLRVNAESLSGAELALTIM